jgi:DNA-binding Xre family transcriptional regulator
MKVKITLNIQKLAKAAGITNASQLMRALACSNETAYLLWSEKSDRLRLDTIARLCEVLNCQPADLILASRAGNGKATAAGRASGRPSRAGKGSTRRAGQ